MGFVNIGRPHVLIKCMEKRWISLLYDKGSIRFSCPKKWVDIELKEGRGQGDKFEGCFAIDCLDIDREVYYKKKYKNNLIINYEEEMKYYQLRKTLGSPTFCFYSLADNHLQFPDKIDCEGVYKVQCEISGQYFKDFAHGKSIKEIEKLPEEEKPALLVIVGYNNIKSFFKRIREQLYREYGLVDSNIYIDQVSYAYSRDIKASFCGTKSNPPLELFYKGKEFEYQREARIVINSKKYNFANDTDKFLDLKIGDLKDIAKVVDLYSSEGFNVEMEVFLSKIEDIVARDGEVYDGYGGL